MSKIQTILAALFCATAPLSGTVGNEEKTEVVQSSSFSLGSETIAFLRSDYDRGVYRDFLKEMGDRYEKADLSSLIEMRTGSIAPLNPALEKQFYDLKVEKNKELLALISPEDQSLFAEKVRSVAVEGLSRDQELALAKIYSLVAKAPGTGMNADENTLILIDLEYEYKLLELNDPSLGLSFSDIEQKRFVLRMEKMDRMAKAAEDFTDLSLKEAVAIASNTLDQRLAQNIDGHDLYALAKGKPNNSTEEKVAELLQRYQEKFQSLLK